MSRLTRSHRVAAQMGAFRSHASKGDPAGPPCFSIYAVYASNSLSRSCSMMSSAVMPPSAVYHTAG